MPFVVAIVEDYGRVAVRCPVCNAPVISGTPAGRFRLRCRRPACHTILEITSAASGALLERLRESPDPKGTGPCPA